MGFDWLEYLKLAEYLQKCPCPDAASDESFLRSAISRAYYAAFHHALDYAQRNLKFIPTNLGEDHRRLILHYQAHRGSATAAYLDDLLAKRKKCDYAAKVTDLKTNSLYSINLAKKIFDSLKI